MHLLLHRSVQLCSDLGRGADWESPLDDLGAGERRARLAGWLDDCSGCRWVNVGLLWERVYSKGPHRYILSVFEELRPHLRLHCIAFAFVV